MFGLAVLSMRGRMQATLTVVLLTALPMMFFVAAPILALVFLRHGLGEGLRLYFWALAPAVAWAMLPEAAANPIPLLMLSGVALSAAVLRQTANLLHGLLSLVVVGLIINVVLSTVLMDWVSLVATEIAEVMAQSEQVVSVEQWQQLLAHAGAGYEFFIALALLLARAWQAALYNPGGFRKEFHQLRLPLPVAAAMMLGIIVSQALATQIGTWAEILIVPLWIVAMAVVHSFAAFKGLTTVHMGLIYAVVIMMFAVVSMLLVLLAVADSALDLRRRWTTDPGS